MHRVPDEKEKKRCRRRSVKLSWDGESSRLPLSGPQHFSIKQSIYCATRVRCLFSSYAASVASRFKFDADLLWNANNKTSTTVDLVCLNFKLVVAVKIGLFLLSISFPPVAVKQWEFTDSSQQRCRQVQHCRRSFVLNNNSFFFPEFITQISSFHFFVSITAFHTKEKRGIVRLFDRSPAILRSRLCSSSSHNLTWKSRGVSSPHSEILNFSGTNMPNRPKYKSSHRLRKSEKINDGEKQQPNFFSSLESISMSLAVSMCLLMWIFLKIVSIDILKFNHSIQHVYS